MVCHNCGVLDHVSRFASNRQVLVVPSCRRSGPRRDCSQESLSVRRTPAPLQLPPQASRHSPAASPATVPQTELLLRSRGLQEESHTPVGPLPGPDGLPRRRDDPHQRHAARANTTPAPRAFHSLQRRPADHRSLAGLLARALSPDTILDRRTRPFGAACRGGYPAILARGRFPRPPSPL
jgi:hypothetical protein